MALQTRPTDEVLLTAPPGAGLLRAAFRQRGRDIRHQHHLPRHPSHHLIAPIMLGPVQRIVRADQQAVEGIVGPGQGGTE